MRHRITSPVTHGNDNPQRDPRSLSLATFDPYLAAHFAAYSPDPCVDLDQVAAVLRDLAAVPATELPVGPAREALIAAIASGAVDGVYSPFGADYHNLTLAWLPADREPRRRIAEWLAVWRLAGQWRALWPVTLFLADGWQPGAPPEEPLVTHDTPAPGTPEPGKGGR